MLNRPFGVNNPKCLVKTIHWSDSAVSFSGSDSDSDLMRETPSPPHLEQDLEPPAPAISCCTSRVRH